MYMHHAITLCKEATQQNNVQAPRNNMTYKQRSVFPRLDFWETGLNGIGANRSGEYTRFHTPVNCEILMFGDTTDKQQIHLTNNSFH